jgi:hypothetical protein
MNPSIHDGRLLFRVLDGCQFARGQVIFPENAQGNEVGTDHHDHAESELDKDEQHRVVPHDPLGIAHEF